MHRFVRPVSPPACGLEEWPTGAILGRCVSTSARMVSRVRWWETVQRRATPVIMGHYWRRFDPESDIGSGKYGPDLVWPRYARQRVVLGKKRNVHCADFSVGARHMLTHERAGRGADHLQTRCRARAGVASGV